MTGLIKEYLKQCFNNQRQHDCRSQCGSQRDKGKAWMTLDHIWDLESADDDNGNDNGQEES